MLWVLTLLLGTASCLRPLHLGEYSWDWQDNFKVIMGMNKIYIGLERYNISVRPWFVLWCLTATHISVCRHARSDWRENRIVNRRTRHLPDVRHVTDCDALHCSMQHMEAYAVANPLVVQQSVEQIVTALPKETEKFITINGGTKELYPCDSTEKNIYYVKSGTQKNFYHDITESPPMMMNEGYTVTHYSLQALYYLGCQTVYIVGMDHSFQQSGGPNQKQLMKGEDPNVSKKLGGQVTQFHAGSDVRACREQHFDPSYFQGHEVSSHVIARSPCHKCACVHVCLCACLFAQLPCPIASLPAPVSRAPND
jgi:hypothetical protein